VTVGPYVRVNLIDYRGFTTVTIAGQSYVKKGTLAAKRRLWTVSAEPRRQQLIFVYHQRLRSAADDFPWLLWPKLCSPGSAHNPPQHTGKPFLGLIDAVVSMHRPISRSKRSPLTTRQPRDVDGARSGARSHRYQAVDDIPNNCGVDR
jgi:hypothetical protein